MQEGATGKILENWVFDDDAYALAVTSLVRRGAAGAVKEFAMALVTPTLSIVGARALVMFLLREKQAGSGEKETEQEDDLQAVHWLCFVLAGLTLSNEMHEGMCKLVFSLRACTGVYEGVSAASLSLGIILGICQVLMAMTAMALNMQLVSTAETLLDCFLNFVAVAFLTEIDNLVLESRTFKGWVKDYEGPGVEVTRVMLEKRTVTSSHAQDLDSQAWLRLLLFFTPGVLAGTGMSILIYVWVGAVRDPPQEVDWLPMLPGAAVAFVLVTLLIYVTKWLPRYADVLIVLAVVYQVFLILKPHVGSILVRNLLFMYSIFGVAIGAAVDHDPFGLLWCPFRMPFAIWVMMYGAVCWMERLREEGLA